MNEIPAERSDFDDVFTVLADEIRLKILRTLWEIDAESVSFSDLRESTGVRDSGQFNYHLNKLVPRFVTKIDGEYQLTQAGKHVNGAIVSGIFTSQRSIGPFQLDSSCPSCGGDQTFQYNDDVAKVQCESCPVSWAMPVPPAVLAGYDRSEIPNVISRYFRTRFQFEINGFCSYCYGSMVQTVGTLGTLDVGASPDDVEGTDLPIVQFDCQRCNARAGIGIDVALLLNLPDVLFFFHENDIEPWENPIWGQDPELGEGWIEQHDPVRAKMAYRAGDSELLVTIDDSFNVVDIEWNDSESD